MSQERKKVVRKEIPKIEPKKRPEPMPEIEEIEQPRVKLSDDKYVKVSADAGIEEFRGLSERIQKGIIKWSHYTIDNNKGYHYYLIKK